MNSFPPGCEKLQNRFYILLKFSWNVNKLVEIAVIFMKCRMDAEKEGGGGCAELDKYMLYADLSVYSIYRTMSICK